MASEVAAMEKRKQGGNGKPGKGATAGVSTNSQLTQTDMDTTELMSTALRLNTELSVLQAALQSKDQALTAAHVLHSELRAAHDSVLRRALDAESIQAENTRLSDRLEQAESDGKAHQQMCAKLTQETEAINVELKRLQSQHSELQSQHVCLQAKAESLLASEATHKAELQSMTHHAETAQSDQSSLEAINLAAAQQLVQLQKRSSQLEQTQEQLQAFITDTAHQFQGAAAEIDTPAEAGDLLSAAKALVDCMQRRGEEAEAESVKVTQQLQEVQTAQALEVEQLR